MRRPQKAFVKLCRSVPARLTRRPSEESFGNQLAYALQGLSLVLVNCQRIDEALAATDDGVITLRGLARRDW